MAPPPEDDEEENTESDEGKPKKPMAELLKGSGSTPAVNRVKEFEVLECNFLAALIYQRATLTFVGLSAHCVGVTTADVVAAMSLFQSQLPTSEEEKILLFDDISYIGEVSASILNKKVKANQRTTKK